MKKFLLGTAVLGVSLAGALTVGATSAKADVNVYRLYNRNTGEHFYTTSAAEKTVDVNAGWTYEGIGWIAPTTSSSPVYRVYNPNANGGDHYYTKSKGEAQSLVKLGWKWDNGGKAVFYSGGTKAVYVAYNPNAQSGAHNYTTNSFEQKTLLSGGWRFGATAWYSIAPKTPVTSSFTLGEGEYTVGKQIPAGKYVITSVTHNVGTLFQYHSADYSVSYPSIYLDTTGKYGDKSATVTLKSGIIVVINPSRDGDTVVFTPVK